jgi:endonuclease/exonuclease/phosphatase family protein
MAKIFSVASWNVEHFKNAEPSDMARARRVARFISGHDGGPSSVPDVFALYEVEGKDVFREFMDEFPDHRFHLTEGKQTQEIFIGVHRRLQTFSTQRLEFKTGREYLRPGLLLTIRADGENYPLLFLHVKSGSGPEDFGLRDAALEHAFNLKKALDKAAGNPANFIFLGDLNTMGIDDPVPYYKRMDLTSDEELDRISWWAKKRGMTLLSKETTAVDGVGKEITWYNGSSGYKPANLDHVVASDHVQIRSPGNGPFQVAVFGWPRLPRDNWNTWFSSYSDHAMLYFEVWA